MSTVNRSGIFSASCPSKIGVARLLDGSAIAAFSFLARVASGFEIAGIAEWTLPGVGLVVLLFFVAAETDRFPPATIQALQFIGMDRQILRFKEVVFAF